MRKGTQATKMAASSTAPPQPIAFDPKFATMCNSEHTLAKLPLATHIWYIQEYENNIYKEIM
jgi:hypothetical protein